MRKTAKVFMSGRSQAVRLPKEFRFDTKEVWISRNPDTVTVRIRNCRASYIFTQFKCIIAAPNKNSLLILLLFFYCSYSFSRNTGHDCIGRHILCYHRACGNHGVISDGHTRQYCHICSQPDIFPNMNRSRE